MKLVCKCGSVEELKKDKPLENFELKNCGDGTMALVCKKCGEVVFVILK